MAGTLREQLNRYGLAQLALMHGYADQIGLDNPEALHKFRVAGRRSHSLLTLFPQAFIGDEQHQLKHRLKSIIRMTNPLRDRDVLRLLLDSFADARLGHFVARQRAEQQDALAKLQDPLHDALAALQGTAVSVFGQIATDCRLDSEAVACATHLQAKLERSLRRAGQMSDEQLHKLRIRFKQLRYLCEFAGDAIPSLYEQLAQLKQLQQQLGEFNDRRLQLDLCRRLQGQGAAELASLVDWLAQDYQQLRVGLQTQLAMLASSAG